MNGETNREDNTGFSETLHDFSGNEELIKCEDIEGSPFKKIKTNEGNFIAIGLSRVTFKLTDEEIDEKEKGLKSIDWNLLLSAISVITKQTVALHHLEIMNWEKDRLEKAIKE